MIALVSMQQLEYLVGVAGIASALAAVFLALLSRRTYRQLTPEAQMVRRQNEHMDHLAVLVMQILDKIAAVRDLHIKEKPVAWYLFPALAHDARQLDKLLDRCAKLGLARTCLVDPRRQFGKTDLWQMNTAFRASIIELSQLKTKSISNVDLDLLRIRLDPIQYEQEERSLWREQVQVLKLHFATGMIRLGDACLAFKSVSIKEDLDRMIGKASEREAAWWKTHAEDNRTSEIYRCYASNYIPNPEEENLVRHSQIDHVSKRGLLQRILRRMEIRR